jgi:hypothetical protein
LLLGFNLRAMHLLGRCSTTCQSSSPSWDAVFSSYRCLHRHTASLMYSSCSISGS